MESKVDSDITNIRITQAVQGEQIGFVKNQISDVKNIIERMEKKQDWFMEVCINYDKRLLDVEGSQKRGMAYAKWAFGIVSAVAITFISLKIKGL